jgi:hypothetical protein
MDDLFEQVVFVSFGTTPEWSQAHCRMKKAIRKNFSSASMFFKDQNWLRGTEFFNKHSDFFISHKKGYGLWLWKPFIIKEALSIFKKSKYIVYLDAGTELNVTHSSLIRLNFYFEIVEKLNGLAFSLNMKEKDFTSPFTFSKLKTSTNTNNQISAAVIIFKNNSTTNRFVSEWLTKMIDNDYQLTKGYNSLDKEIFDNHRYDQSILSLLWHKTSFSTINDETFFEKNWANGHNYPFWVARNRLFVSIKSNSALKLVFRLYRRLLILLKHSV